MIRLSWQAARHQWRLHLGVWMGVALTTALVVGGLAMGDALRAALSARVSDRLGPVDVVLRGRDVGFSADHAAWLARELPARTAGVVMRPAVVSSAQGRARQVSLVGADGALGQLAGQEALVPEPGSVRIGAELAGRLGVVPGDRIVVRVERPGALPRDSALMQEEGSVLGLSVAVGPLLEGAWPTHLGMDATPGQPDVALVSLAWLQDRLGMPGRVDRVLVAGATPDQVASALTGMWTLEDGGLTLAQAEGEVALSSDRVLFTEVVARAATSPALGGTPGLVWFVEEARSARGAAPYVFVGAVPPDGAADVSLGLPDDLGADEVVLNHWMARDLDVAVGEPVTLRYPLPGRGRRVAHGEATFTVRAIMPDEGPWVDRSWTPPIEGLDGEASCREWNPGLPVDLGRIRDLDEAYWEAHGGAPRAWVGLQTGQRLWANRHGDLTTLRVAGQTPEAVLAALQATLLPADLGAQVVPVRAHLTAAATPANDFGGLFAGFQFLLIVSALLLTALQASFAFEHRGGEVGVLRAVGWSRGRTMALLGLEAGWVVGLGVLVGLPLAGLVAYGFVVGLDAVWSTATTGVALPWQMAPGTVVLGGLLSGGMAWGAVAWMLRSQVREAPRTLLAGGGSHGPGRAAPWAPWLAVVGLVGALAVALLTPAARTPSAALGFFGAGGLLVTGGLGLARAWLDRVATQPLGARSAGRRPQRALAVVALLALGTFLVAGVGLGGGRATPDATSRDSGSGGFAWIGETTLAVHGDLTTTEGLGSLGLPPGAVSPGEVVGLMRVDGDDASCLQLGSAQAPTLLGVPATALAGREAFTFLEADAADGSPWSLLDADLGPGRVPAIGDVSTVTWGLHLSRGDAVTWINEAGEPVDVVIVGVIGSSVFQGSLLVSEAAIATHFPSVGGVRTLLVDAAGARADEVAASLTRALEDRGVALEPTADRLAAFTAVEDTYVAIFRALGGAGLMLGGLGVGLVLLRGVQERRAELALLRAMGFPAARVRRLLVAEHAALVMWGLVLGTVSAALAVAPILMSPEVDAPLGSVAGMVLGTAVVSLLALWMAARWALREVPLAALAAERR